jgi:16S rRNA (guanine527-N7)-methyltransferase
MNLIRQAPAATASEWGLPESRQLDQGLQVLELQPSPQQIDRLRVYGSLLMKWNRTYNLLGATSVQAVVEQHLLDTLAILPALTRWLPTQRPLLVDVGSGAGLPGLLLAIMQPDVTHALVEPIGKKAAFLRQAVAACRLTNAHVLEQRIEDARLDAVPVPPGDTDQPVVPHFICRAFTSLERFVALCLPHLRPGPPASILFAMKALKVSDELKQLAGAVTTLAVEELRTVERDVQRYLVVLSPSQSSSLQDIPAAARSAERL